MKKSHTLDLYNDATTVDLASDLASDRKNILLLFESLKDLYNSIPANSPIRSSLVQSLFSSTDTKFAANLLGVDESSIRKASTQ